MVFLILILYFLHFCITISCSTSLLTVNPLAIQVGIDITIKPIPVTDNVIVMVDVAILTIVSNEFNFVVNIFYFYICLSI